ncbi:hypothetical protein [Devosia salina]|uniref:Uncharacterized protein n=1 Tax=Devosia salina TaxID=2860336 RepID=A0ABX8WGE2_9HYPH|nr:hypothetical protein [Devosia salina]QYO77295.1 hypothetical protein K1X15_01540 [Devosia salina]|tara:strand:- start:2301 stop:2513 length:213 start_codon:yes stop_codon:yes gene_type:complete
MGFYSSYSADGLLLNLRASLSLSASLPEVDMCVTVLFPDRAGIGSGFGEALGKACERVGFTLFRRYTALT